MAARPRPYWTPSGKRGLHLGYRRLVNTNGSWIVRRYQGQAGEYDTKAFAQADDFSDADNSEVLTYYQAIARLTGEAPPVRHGGEQYTVRSSVADYLAWLKIHKKTPRDAALKLNAYLIPVLGDKPLEDLKPEEPASVSLYDAGTNSHAHCRILTRFLHTASVNVRIAARRLHAAS